MGTRAQFFVGDPRDVEGREWLGTVAWDGYPDGDCGDLLVPARTEQQFRDQINVLAESRDDFCDPAKNDFPFPWRDNLFLTDCTYAWFDGAVQVTWFQRGFIPLAAYRADPDGDGNEAYHAGTKELASDVPAPRGNGSPGPDSIMILRAAK